MTEHSFAPVQAATSTASTTSEGLRKVLGVDAITCLAMGVVLLAFAGALGNLLGLPVRLLLAAGLVLLPCAALMYATARSAGPNRALVWLVLLGNLAWIVASLGIAVLLAPPPLGIAFLLGQAAVVALLGILEYRGFRGTFA